MYGAIYSGYLPSIYIEIKFVLKTVKIRTKCFQNWWIIVGIAVQSLVRLKNLDEKFMYNLKHEHECFIRYKIGGAAERFIADKARIASVLNSLKNDPFYTYLVTLFTKKFLI